MLGASKSLRSIMSHYWTKMKYVRIEKMDNAEFEQYLNNLYRFNNPPCKTIRYLSVGGA